MQIENNKINTLPRIFIQNNLSQILIFSDKTMRESIEITPLDLVTLDQKTDSSTKAAPQRFGDHQRTRNMT